ncbi:hypothetical protein GCM10011361_09640 [Muriicola marianensis]|uniref:Uncharacterized protein n=1 Tax=Muriicola marianensis TaxID=1324801 RepID=A0ABQ1QUQ0_9FLAO|nr:hypothetical protein GCM10011361_09640 [Muriicola marianensis]
MDDADADPNNEIQDLSLAANTLSLTGDATPVDLSGYLDNTDAQDLTGASLSGANILQIDIQNGASTTVDLSSLDNPGTDDQTAAEVSYDNITSGLTAITVQDAIDEVVASGPTAVFHSLGFINGLLPDGDPGAIRNGFNIASITKISTGNYRVNFTTVASSTDYVVQLTLRATLSGASIQVIGQQTTDFTVQIKEPDDITNLDAQFYFTVIDF